MPWRPVPWWGVVVSNPVPLSVMVKWRLVLVQVRWMVAWVAWAYLVMFWRASRVQK